MALDEQLRELANRVPPPPPGDATSVFRRGRRRRRVRHVAGAATVIVMVAALGVSVGYLFDGPTLLDIADRPPAATEQDRGEAGMVDAPVITGPPELTVSADGPFAWTVLVSAGEDRGWCATAVRRFIEVGEVAGLPCDHLLTPEQVGDPAGFGGDGSKVEASESGGPAQGVSWGFAPSGTDEVFVLFSDGSRQQAAVASGGSVPAPLWAIGYEGVEVQAALTVRRTGVFYRQLPTTEGRCWGVLVMPLAARWWLARGSSSVTTTSRPNTCCPDCS
jgi:hypothetical protein